jgi:UDP-N-acetylglucosamine diphosphorylase/glucosamine-1-phosphate N-acetyltransferase
MRVQVLLVEHDDVGGLYPFSTTHCAWELRVGAFTILERWQRSVPTTSVTVASDRDLHMRSFVERYETTAPYQPLPTLIVAAHVLISPSVMRQMVEACAATNHPMLFYCGGQPMGVFLMQAPESPAMAVAALDTIDVHDTHTIDVAGHVITRMWQALDHIADAIRWDAQLVQEHIHHDASIHPTAVIDATGGPVLLLEHAQVGPLALITGPCVVGAHSIVRPHASLNTVVVGPTSRISGEVSHSIMQGYGNKQHDGFVGHTFIGEWCNLGAGTITSNLKNTYGHVHMTMPWLEEDTQRQFVGTLMGDHVRTAIGTRFSTGTVIGTFANVVSDGFPPRAIGPFTWMVGGSGAVYDIDKALAVARAAMARRMTDLGRATEAVLREVHRQAHG